MADQTLARLHAGHLGLLILVSSASCPRCSAGCAPGPLGVRFACTTPDSINRGCHVCFQHGQLLIRSADNRCRCLHRQAAPRTPSHGGGAALLRRHHGGHVLAVAVAGHAAVNRSVTGDLRAVRVWNVAMLPHDIQLSGCCCRRSYTQLFCRVALTGLCWRCDQPPTSHRRGEISKWLGGPWGQQQAAKGTTSQTANGCRDG